MGLLQEASKGNRGIIGKDEVLDNKKPSTDKTAGDVMPVSYCLEMNVKSMQRSKSLVSVKGLAVI